ncbi:DUF4177 domain-containing protein [Clostridium sp. MB05]|jgi:Domain of unknown function (DUF4177)|uniref:DUF4177 domain-containing protein n=1 Tax=Clostridium sp. MB05 TaxID=3376682 RepID=UPI0039822B0E
MKWEYKVIEINSIKGLGDSEELQKELNNYGEAGWELVGGLTKPHEGVGWIPKSDEGSVIFKREIV